MLKEKEHISASKISLIKDCLGKYYFRYIKKNEEKEILFSGTLIGIVIHSLLEDCVNIFKQTKKIKTVNEFIDENFALKYDSILNKEININKKILYKKKGFSEKQFLKDGIKWSKELFYFLDRYIIKYSEDYFAERRFEIEEQEYLITGVKDFIALDKEGNIHVADFKTTSDMKKWYFVDYRNDIQSLFYSWAALREFGNIMKAFSYLILSKDDRFIFVNNYREIRTEEEIKKSFSVIVDYVRKASKDSLDFSKWTPEESKCNFCTYVNICDYSKSKEKNFRKMLKII